ncbi:MAG: metallophosphoesterase [Acidobacteriaceae bacterium]|nr:metallophosphoesterase [Acidobacteriaceae bacterium]
MRLLFAAVANAQQTSANPATHELLSEAGPTFRVADQEIPSPVTFIAYGDIRFTDPANGDVTNPQVRQWLVKKVAEEAPAAILLSGDVPFTGGNNNDYLIYRSETQPWRRAHVRVFPALGNHEFRGGSPEDACKLVGGVSGASRPAVVFGATRFEGLYHHFRQRRLVTFRQYAEALAGKAGTGASGDRRFSDHQPASSAGCGYSDTF